MYLTFLLNCFLPEYLMIVFKKSIKIPILQNYNLKYLNLHKFPLNIETRKF